MQWLPLLVINLTFDLMFSLLDVLSSTGEGHAQTTAVVAQCCGCLLFRQPGGARSNPEAVQHQTQTSEHRKAIVARTVSARNQSGTTA